MTIQNNLGPGWQPPTVIKNSNLQVLGKLQNPIGYSYIFAWNTKVKKYIVKRLRHDVSSEVNKQGGGNENRYVMHSFAELTNWYAWAISKGWDVIQALPLTHDSKLE